ncbi:M24 family metallopeptidase [Polymorphobacter multimanifer]|uniref:M24 family metallopeptidase n=1 Tax=Polymorphobacter multimanifer TaxID=1070431 RepID=UPI001FB0DB32|nr:M24 family metallopeptidase [Polymorphobacter multimanifer]
MRVRPTGGKSRQGLLRGAALGLVAMVMLASPAMAAIEERPAYPKVLPMRERAAVVNRLLADRLDTVVPAIMRERGVDMWVIVARENFEEPVVATMLDAESLLARRRTILVFFDPGPGKPLERFTVSRYGLGGLFAPSWEPEKQPDQWARLAEIIAELNPSHIAINSSPLTAFADGMTLSAYEGMMAALTPAMRSRIIRDEQLAVRWLETRTPAEMAIYPEVMRLAHAILAEGLSSAVITPGKTTTRDVVWWYRQKIADLGLTAWFQPSVAISRKGAERALSGDTVIEKGDLIWTDFGITYLRCNTDTQQNAYVLRDGETEAPAGLRAGLNASNRLQDALTDSFRAGDTGNAVLARARARALAEGLDPSVDSRPIGFHGHGAGAAIGFWDNQNPDPRGEHRVFPNTAWSIELSATAAVPEWGGQRIGFKTEQDAFFDGNKVTYIDKRRTELWLIGKGGK